jgi:hypothetical protein
MWCERIRLGVRRPSHGRLTCLEVGQVLAGLQVEVRRGERARDDQLCQKPSQRLIHMRRKGPEQRAMRKHGICPVK